MKPILEVRGVQKSFGSYAALRGINLAVRSGEIISVLGPSGCGKSTLLQVIAGLTRPDVGEVLLRGEQVASPSRLVPPEKRNLNMVFQDYALWPHMSVYANIAYGLQRKKMKADLIQAKIAELVKLLRLEGLEQRLPPDCRTTSSTGRTCSYTRVSARELRSLPSSLTICSRSGKSFGTVRRSSSE